MTNPSDTSFSEAPYFILPLRNRALFPGAVVTLPIGRPQSVALVRTLRPGNVVAALLQRDPEQEQPTLSDLHHIGVLGVVRSVESAGSDSFRITIEGEVRVEVRMLVQTQPYWRASGERVEDVDDDGEEAFLLAEALAEQLVDMGRRNNSSVDAVLALRHRPGPFADQVAAFLGLAGTEAAELIAAVNVPERLRLVLAHLVQARERAELKQRIEQEVRQTVNRSQREALLREQLRIIKRDLGEDSQSESGRLREKLEEVPLTEEARKLAERELRRLDDMIPMQPEYHVIRTFLELMSELPWGARAETSIDLDAISAKLDADHYGLQEVKRRILEHMAVMQRARNPRGTILCLSGPPGVGKTSLGQSIADATGRPMVRMALGGMKDEAEIRGHRRTYIGAMPGRVIQGLRKAQVKNPLMVLDEVDKLGQSWNGNPENALLEVLDPEQNGTFTDHYLEVAFDLSEVFFLCTANNIDQVSAPLRDRLEIIEISGYTQEEKEHIARKHIIPKLLDEFGFGPEDWHITDQALHKLIHEHTREAGVRQLKRELTRICRRLTLRAAKAQTESEAYVVDLPQLDEILGRPKFHAESAERTAVPGVAVGVAWTAAGGDILFVESSKMPGSGRLELTGQLGSVMQESAKAALAYLRAHSQELGLTTDFFDKTDVHIHFPSGAVPKDGPSAGVTILTALTSLFTGRCVRSDTAMTGECTLRGRVLPVGGIKAKVLAAHRAGIKRFILPKRNREELEEVPEDVRADLDFVLVEEMSEVLSAALEAAGEELSYSLKKTSAPVSVPL
ncbi:MAG: endopeptidase La [Myxococcota bacterium]|jgi:ATP-dependent Lon protease|nr:endopeptidase La [Myxococcota bacterium]